MGCISCDRVGRLAKADGRINAQRYIGLLTKELLHFMTSLGPEFMLMVTTLPVTVPVLSYSR